ncbi:MAG: hypothetical protein F6K48_07610 [Okeania sp. SIO3H1]|nr:hypothetical protein [Okeania sp. SIO3H1]
MTYSRRKKEEGRRRKEEGRRKKEEGRRKKEEGFILITLTIGSTSIIKYRTYV